MKRTISAWVTVIISVLLLASACKKELSNRLMHLPKIAHPPVARAGMDTTIFYPFSFYDLNGSGSTDPDSNITSYSWRMLSGPSPVGLTNPDKVKASASGLINLGTYTFELTVTDADKLSGKDTVIISVVAPDCNGANKEIILKDMEWNYSWIMEIDIYNIFSVLPANSHLKNIYIKRDGTSDWENVVPFNAYSPDYQFHTWAYGNHVFVIFPSNNNITNDTPDVKIEYCL